MTKRQVLFPCGRPRRASAIAYAIAYAITRAVVGGVAVVMTVAACSPSKLVDVTANANIVDPAKIQTADGAHALFLAALGKFAVTFGGGTQSAGDYVTWTGVFTDEFGGTTTVFLGPYGVDARTVSNYVNPYGFAPNVFGAAYTQVQATRIQAQQAHGALERYMPNAPTLAGQAFALEGYTELMLGELFCSGIPLSRSPFDEESTYAPASSTDEVLAHATQLFDSALTLSADSARILNLARVGKARALLQRGQFDAAAAAVHDVPTTFTYAVEYSTTVTGQSNLVGAQVAYASLTDREGTNGMPWISAHDPRVPVSATARAQKYLNGSAPIVLASGIEARLIEAEAALHDGDISGWSSALNTLRATAISPALPALTADSTTTASAAMRVDVLFRERAFWLYATGHRQGDMRRLVHQYERAPDTVYPSGAAYGTDVVGLTADTEQQYNPLYHGCFDTNA